MPARHWVLDESRQPTDESAWRLLHFADTEATEGRTRSQLQLDFDPDSQALEASNQQYELTALIDSLRQELAAWRALPEASWRVTPETGRLLKHWRHYAFGGIRPFFCQIEAVETAIWLTEVAPRLGNEGRRFLDWIEVASEPPLTLEQLREAHRSVSGNPSPVPVGIDSDTVYGIVCEWRGRRSYSVPCGPIRRQTGLQRMYGRWLEHMA